ncbi:hypothetical protein [Winogradskyella sp.]|uniref:hypothetical protein n=1 Tax=Winogradskyella sp. TaxID=1883156 RepID=UPI0025D90A8B|nr:hypothetical protein [Winogradskyella sp.]
MRLTYVNLVAILFFGCSNEYKRQVVNLGLNKEKAYLIFRGTNTKEGFFAREFNIKDTLSSHVGFTLFDSSRWNVFHVLENKNSTTDYNVEILDGFLNKEKNKVFYYSLWEIESLKLEEIDSLRKIIKRYKSKKITFDKNFSHKDSTKLDCSEFICEALNKINSDKFNFEFHKRELKGIYKTYFKKDTLEYYPVDMFQSNANFKFFFEWNNQ